MSSLCSPAVDLRPCVFWPPFGPDCSCPRAYALLARPCMLAAGSVRRARCWLKCACVLLDRPCVRAAGSVHARCWLGRACSLLARSCVLAADLVVVCVAQSVVLLAAWSRSCVFFSIQLIRGFMSFQHDAKLPNCCVAVLWSNSASSALRLVLGCCCWWWWWCWLTRACVLDRCWLRRG